MHTTDTMSSTSLHQSAYTGDLRNVRRLVEEEGGDVTALDADSRTPLHWAALGGRLDVVEFLLASGAARTVSRRDGDGWAPLTSAAAGGHVAVVRALIAAGADVATTTADGNAPLHYHKGRVPVIDALLPHVAYVDARNRVGATSLHRAAGPGYTDAARALLAAGADVNAADAGGRTPLHLACEEGRAETALLLLSHGADHMLRTKDGRAALDCCADARMRNTLISAVNGAS